ncbi:elongation of very long chain fatty acids protein 7-like [Ostrinia furnacalis]|uniref:elongation of very long chain fatty acids protein 7-like n=1 Tax=Ostrinia furnacalis TaxID=93504 RepID=UPI001040DE52|nr:elongation of very long chain fatty acids protein 7-like [Ostrinia furnacalis]
MSYLEKVDKYLDSLKVGKSAMVDSWFMMSSPSPIIGVVIAYLVVIRLVPVIMKNRPPMQMNKLITYYNASQVLLATMICAKAFKLNLFKDGILYAGCRYPSNTQNPMLLDLGWWYFFAKFTELLDTVFFVLRKKNSQVTFLHVYHHVIMAVYSWSYLKFAAGGQGAILALLNSIVHVVMYTYYLLSGLGPRFQKYLWWKRYVTRMQLIQFALMLVYCAWTHFSPRCQYASGFTYFICANVTIFLLLFLNFYSKSYKAKKNVEKEIKEVHEKTRNGIKSNGVKTNGVTQSEENGKIHKNADDDTPYEVNNICGDYEKDGKVFLTRRTAKTAFGPQYDFDSIIKK